MAKLYWANDKCGSNIGILINWGRSVIEDRNVNGPINHIKYAVQKKVLAGLMFSGTTANDNNLYGAWSDLHMPPAPFGDYQYFEPQSLMTYESIKKSLAECDMNALEFIGLKLLAMPKESTISFPMPFHAKIYSTNTAPAKSDANQPETTVTTGFNAFRNACLKTTTDLFKPFAVAVLI